jgi:hypothetical protein
LHYSRSILQCIALRQAFSSPFPPRSSDDAVGKKNLHETNLLHACILQIGWERPMLADLLRGIKFRSEQASRRPGW